MAHYLVTGVAGFIGNNLARALLARGERVRGVDNFVTGRRENLDGVTQIELVEGDIRDGAVAARAVAGIDFVLHQAAIPSVPRSIDAPLASHEANATGTLNLLEAARQAGVRRFVYAASSSAYGDTPVLPKIETMPANPQSPYAVSKLAGEHYCKVYAKVFGLETVALRYFNVFGPRQDPTSRYAAVVPSFVQHILRGSAPPIHGDGLQTRDFTYIDNVIEANLLAASAPNVSGEMFNVACGASVDLLGVVATANTLLGKNVAPTFLPERRGDVRHSLASIEKARSLLGYRGAVDFKTGLERAIAWYSDNLR